MTDHHLVVFFRRIQDLIAEYQQYETAGIEGEEEELYEQEYQEDHLDQPGEDSIQYADDQQ